MSLSSKISRLYLTSFIPTFPTTLNRKDFENFVSQLHIPALSEAYKNLMDKEITSEVSLAIKKAEYSKIPRPDVTNNLPRI